MSASPYDLLLPVPQQLTPTGGSWSPAREGRLTLDAPAEWRAAIERALARPLGDAGLALGFASTGADVQVDVGGEFAEEAYRLRVASEGVRVEASHLRGARHGLRTLGQALRIAAHQGPSALPGVLIDDAPDLARRGYMLDISRDRVPRPEELRLLIERLAEWKVEHLQLYMEHTFAYAGHEEVWAGSSALSPDEVRSLDAFAASHGVELVPNQNSFGHLHRWLVHPRYAPLAEVPEGIEHAFAVDKEPFSLCPTDPAALELLEDLFDQLLPCFESRLFNVGCDETIDLGLGRSKKACETRGKGRVYFDFLRTLHERVAARGRRMVFWADIAQQHPELVPELPEDGIAVAWGYEKGHKWEPACAPFAQAGHELWVCPGTSSWQSLVGRIDNLEANVSEAAAAAREYGAAGLLMTDWGDYGHWQPPCTALPGMLLGANSAWNLTAQPAQLADLLDVHVLGDRAGQAGAALVALGLAHRELASPAVNGASTFFLLRYAREALPIERAPDINAAGFERFEAALSEALASLAASRMTPGIGERVRAELEWAARASAWAARVGTARVAAGPGTLLADVPALQRQRLAEELADVIEEHRRVWLASSRPGGLSDSVARFQFVSDLLQTIPR